MSEGLKVARVARGSQEWFVRAIERYAREHMLEAASTASLRVYVSEWENGKRPISARYARIIRGVLGITNDELMGRTRQTTTGPTQLVDGYADLIDRIDSAKNVSSTMVKTFMDQTELLRTQDRQLGAAGLVDQMTGHLATLEDALTFAVLPDTRRPVAAALAGAATLAAWQALDAGAVERAWRHYELGKRAALEANAPMYLVHAMAEQAYVLCDAGRTELAIGLVRDALQTGGTQISPRLRAWLHAAEAEICAKAGLKDECRQSLDRAAECLPPGEEARDPDMLSIFLNAGHLTRWRGNALALIGDDDAMSSLYAALESMDPTFIRAESGLRCDLAQAHLAREEFGQAQEHLKQARLLAGRTGSVRRRRRIEQISYQL